MPASVLAPFDVGIDVGIAVIGVRIEVSVVDIGVAGKVRPVRSVHGAAGSSVYTHFVLTLGSVNRQRKHPVKRPM